MAERVLMKGNEAIAEAAIRAGCRHYFGYPITPQTEIAAYMAKKMPKIGGVFLQAESEIASINMVYGASAAGMRVMTSSSSPGISLKAEGLSYLAGSDIPAFVVNVQRGGPGLGGIQPSQADYFQATKGGGHGDYHMIVLAPASVQEMASLTFKGFDLADKYNMTAMILADGTIGQMMEPITFEEDEVKQYDKPWALSGHEGKRKHNIVNSLYLKPDELERKNFERFERYKLVEENEAMWEEYRMEDAEIETYEKPWALTGTECKRKHNIVNSLYLKPDELEAKNFERYERYAIVEENEPMWEEFMMEDADLCIVAFGIASRVAKNAVVAARAEGIKVGLIRPITLWPFPKKVLEQAAEKVKGFVCVELSMGQMIEDVRLATQCKKPVGLVCRSGGMVPSPDEVLAGIENAVKGVY